MTTLILNGMTMAPSQVCGAFRLVPLVADRVHADLRLARRHYGARNFGLVETRHDGPWYASYIPQGLVISWSDDGQPVAAMSGQLAARDGTSWEGDRLSLHTLSRLARREAKNRLRFLPLHLAFEGLLARHFAGPEIRWEEFSSRFVRRGLDPRGEFVFGGASLDGFAEALRVFEIHEGQVGVLVFVADALASAFVTPHPDDYRALHESLLTDFYGELIWQYALMHTQVAPAWATIDAGKVDSLDDLQAAVANMRTERAAFYRGLANGLLDTPLDTERVYRCGPFTLERFLTSVDPARENHLGECIRRDDGAIAYLKTYRLSAAQTRRAYLLDRLAAHDWQVAQAAAALQTTPEDLIQRFEKADLGFIFHPHILDRARAARRRRQNSLEKKTP